MWRDGMGADVGAEPGAATGHPRLGGERVQDVVEAVVLTVGLGLAKAGKAFEEDVDNVFTGGRRRAPARGSGEPSPAPRLVSPPSSPQGARPLRPR